MQLQKYADDAKSNKRHEVSTCLPVSILNRSKGPMKLFKKQTKYGFYGQLHR